MKRTDLAIDTVYADANGFPIVLIHTEPVVHERSTGWHEPDLIRLRRAGDRIAGRVLAVRPGYRSLTEMKAEPADLLQEARRLRADLPERVRGGRIEVTTVTPASIVEDWASHLAGMEAAREEKAAREDRDAKAQAARRAIASEIAALVPEGMSVRTYTTRDTAEIAQADLLTLLRQVSRGS
jgi:hypothetical protein